jgi:hypothetical protein
MDQSKTPRHDCRSCRYLSLRRGVLVLSIVQGPLSVAPCQTLISRFATFASLYHRLRWRQGRRSRGTCACTARGAVGLYLVADGEVDEVGIYEHLVRRAERRVVLEEQRGGSRLPVISISTTISDSSFLHHPRAPPSSALSRKPILMRGSTRCSGTTNSAPPSRWGLRS